MIEVKQEKDFVCVTVKMQKRVLAKEPKKFFYTKDAVEEVKKSLPEAIFKEQPLVEHVVSNCKEVQEATWKFPLVKEEKKDLKLSSKRATVVADVMVKDLADTDVDKQTE